MSVNWIKFAGKGTSISCGADNASLIVVNNESNKAFTWDGKWTALPGKILSAARGADNALWCIYEDRSVRKWDGKEWKKVEGEGDVISVGDDNDVLVINNTNNSVWRRRNSKWEKAEFTAKDVEVASDGTVVAAGMDKSIWLWSPEGTVTKLPGQADAVGCGSRNHIWAINHTNNKIFRYIPDKNTWDTVPGAGVNISASPDGGVALISASKDIWCTKPHHVELDDRFQCKWRTIDGEASQVSIGVSSSGSLCVTNKKNHSIWKWNGLKWEQLPGESDSVSCGVDGSIFCIGMDRKPRQYVNGGWKTLPGAGDLVSACTENYAIVTNVKEGGSMFKWDGNEYTKLPGDSVTSVELALDGSMICCNTSGKIYKWLAGETGWTALPGGDCVDASCGGKDSIWIANTVNHIWKWSVKDNKWKRVYNGETPMMGKAISSSYFDHCCVLGTDGKIYMTTY
jgi:hypothetical protein